MIKRELNEKEVDQILGEDVCPKCFGKNKEDIECDLAIPPCSKCQGTGKVSKSEQDEIREAFEKWFEEVCEVTEHKDQFINCYESGYTSASSRIAELEEEVERLKADIYDSLQIDAKDGYSMHPEACRILIESLKK